jgi:CRP/FNR family transcriptional regulator, cyclic AMP receptor protein
LKTQGRFSKRPISQQRLALPFNVESFLRTLRPKTRVIKFGKKTNIFVQGEPAGTVFYIQQGRVTLSVISGQEKSAIIGVLNDGNFFGEGCMAGQTLRMATASAITDCTLLRIEKSAMMAALHERHDFSEFFIAYVLSRNIRYQADLADQLFNSTEKRLARILLLLAHYGKEGQPERIVPNVSHEALAQMLGTTRPQVSHFMNKFRKLGFIEYNGRSKGRLKVHSSLLSAILHR